MQQLINELFTSFLIKVSMTLSLTTNEYAKHYCNRTLIVPVIIENVVTFFSDRTYYGHAYATV